MSENEAVGRVIAAAAVMVIGAVMTASMVGIAISNVAVSHADKGVLSLSFFAGLAVMVCAAVAATCIMTDRPEAK